MGLLARYQLNGLGEGLHDLRRRRAAQLNRPLVVLSCAPPAQGHTLPREVHKTEPVGGVGLILSRGLLEPCHRLLVVLVHTAAIVVHHAEHTLALSVTPLGTDPVRRHRSWVVDRHTLARVVDHANVHGCMNVALARGE